MLEQQPYVLRPYSRSRVRSGEDDDLVVAHVVGEPVKDDRLIENARRMGDVMTNLLSGLLAKHACVGATRSIGLFGIVELVKDRATMEPMAPFNGTSEPMKKLGKFFREEGLYTFVRFNTFFTNPPLIITEEELRHGFDIIDRGLAQL